MTILFDFGGTLDADGTRWSVRFHEAYRRAGGRLVLERFEPLSSRCKVPALSLPSCSIAPRGQSESSVGPNSLRRPGVHPVTRSIG